MANTRIQIKRSSVTAIPAGGSLSAAEPAYSYSSNKLFIGSSDGTDVVEIGGKYWIDTTSAAFTQANAAYTSSNTAYNHAVAAFGTANSGFTYANSVYAFSDAAYIRANAAFLHANSGFGVANNALPKAGGTITGDLVVQGNVTFSGTTTYANTQTLLIGDNILALNADLPVDVAPSENAGVEVNRGSSANVAVLWNEGTDKWTFTNNGTNYVDFASNTDIETLSVGSNTYAAAVGVSANLYAAAVGVSANAYAVTVGTAGNTYAAAVGVSANLYAAAVGTSANAYAVTVGTAANTNAANASYLSTGTVPSATVSGSYTGITGVGTLTVGTWNANTVTVPYGGTGIVSATTNGIIFGNGTGAFQVTAAGTEGQVLQASATGVPSFAMLDGGTF